MEPLKAQIQVLNKVISDQQHYIQELHRIHGHYLEQIPNLHLGAGNAHRGASVSTCPGSFWPDPVVLLMS